jgi:hypothetical protein
MAADGRLRFDDGSMARHFIGTHPGFLQKTAPRKPLMVQNDLSADRIAAE